MQLSNLTKKELINIIYKKENEIDELQRKYNRNQMKMAQLSKSHIEGLELIGQIYDENEVLRKKVEEINIIKDDFHSYQNNVEGLLRYRLAQAHEKNEHIEYIKAIRDILSDIEDNVYL